MFYDWIPTGFQLQATKTTAVNKGYRRLWLTKLNCETPNSADPKTTWCAFGNGCQPHEYASPDRYSACSDEMMLKAGLASRQLD